MGWELLRFVSRFVQKSLLFWSYQMCFTFVMQMCFFPRGSRLDQLGVEQSLKVFVAIFVAGFVQKTTVDLSEFETVFLYQEYL